MRTLVFDIETIGEDWSEIDSYTKESLIKSHNRSIDSDSNNELELQKLKDSLGLSPLTGRIITIGLYDLELGKGAIYYTGEGSEPDIESGDFILKQRSETEMLADFWEGVKDYNVFVTFNGRSFDIPFILHRSIACNVTPTKEILRYRYLSQQSVPFHIDLMEELTFNRAMYKKHGLHMFCRAYGIASSKSSGITGAEIGGLFASKKFHDIAVYNSRDVIATTELYKKWFKNLAPKTFLDIIDLY